MPHCVELVASQAGIGNAAAAQDSAASDMTAVLIVDLEAAASSVQQPVQAATNTVHSYVDCGLVSIVMPLLVLDYYYYQAVC